VDNFFIEVPKCGKLIQSKTLAQATKELKKSEVIYKNKRNRMEQRFAERYQVNPQLDAFDPNGEDGMQIFT